MADLINKYGKSTFWGMFAAILVSKEVFILDAEFMLACEIGAFVLTGYVLTGDTLNKMSEEQDKATVAKFEAASDHNHLRVPGIGFIADPITVDPDYAVQHADFFGAVFCDAEVAFACEFEYLFKAMLKLEQPVPRTKG